MKQVLIQGGSVKVAEVPAPEVGRKNILVAVHFSCISAGTEIGSIKLSGLHLYQRALKQPQHVKRVIEMVKTQGFKHTLERVTGKLAAGSPTGYSTAGRVIAIGEEVNGFSVGDRVACAGAGIANHAEFIDVPVNLAVKIPDALEEHLASTVTLGAIALQGVRRAQPTLGETFVVVGMGILGQLTAQILAAHGCRVIGIDPDSTRVQLAVRMGLEMGICTHTEDYIERVHKYTQGFGVDGAIITAANESHEIIHQAMQACRKKGRVILVGDVGLHLRREDFYKKEIDFLISSSYGPGRYDPVYEEEGKDYPLPYVRWTENRNMQAYLYLLESKKVKLEDILTEIYPINRAPDAYEALKRKEKGSLLALLSYKEQEASLTRRVATYTPNKKQNGKIRVALVGASSFAQGVHLPTIQNLHKDYMLRAVMSRTGANALAVAKQYKADYCATDYEEILKDPDTDLILIASRHDLHGPMVLKALNAGKNVFVEKPLCLNLGELEKIEKFYTQKEEAQTPLLMVGFNRRFSPPIRILSSFLAGITTPIVVNYTMNAGFIPPEHWVHGPEGGGRNIGEACHIYDLFNFLCKGSKEIEVRACAINPTSSQWLKNDNFVATIKYENGSLCTLTYTSLGEKGYPKERMDVFADGKVFVMDDYKSLQVFGSSHKGWKSSSVKKGHKEEWQYLAETLKHGAKWPIDLTEQFQATRISFEVERQIQELSEKSAPH